MTYTEEKFPTFTKIGRAIVYGPINIIKRTWKWSVTIILILAVVHSVATLILGKQVENEIAKIRAKGDPISITELAGKPIPDSENGAVIYEKAFKLIDAISGEKKGNYYGDILFLRFRNDPKAWARARKVLKKSDDIFLLVEQAIAKPQCRFKTNWEDGFNASFPYFMKIRELSRLIAVRTMVNAKDGNISEALKSLKMGYKISDSIKDEPTLIGVLVRIAILGIADKSLQFVVDSSAIDASEAERAISTISKIDLIPGYITAMKGGRVCGLYTFNNAKDLPVDQDMNHCNVSISSLELSYLGRPIFYLDKANYIRLMNKTIDQDILIPYRNLPKDVFDKQNRSDYYGISNMLLISNGFRSMVDSGQAILTGGQLLLALCAYKHQYGSYPETLSELKSKTSFKVSLEDPFSGKDFIYKPKDNGFLLYSLGENLKGDGGIDKTTSFGKYDDIVWQMDH